jgi:CRP-like cAMP-binding protein
MSSTGRHIIATRLMEMTGLDMIQFGFVDFSECFEGPICLDSGDRLWDFGDTVGYLWFIESGFGFDRMLLENGKRMLNGMIEPGIFVCDEQQLIFGVPSASQAIVHTPTIAYRISCDRWFEFLDENQGMASVIHNINAHFIQMRKARLLKMKHMEKRAYWDYIKDRFPGVEQFCTQTEIAHYFGVSKSTMHRIMKEA